MLFNSYEFLLVFLPLAIAVYAVADRFASARVPALLLLSLIFYGCANAWSLLVLLASIVMTWLAARAYALSKRSAVITAAIVGNLALLGFFKYTNFLADNLSYLTGMPIAHIELALPLGISFFTFHHISYLIDLRNETAPPVPFDRYALYICFFPKIIAGPIARSGEFANQLGQRAFAPGWERRCALAAAFIIIGLLQKVLLADTLAKILDPIYAKAASGPLPDGQSWLALMYIFQIFFDFSGYSDVAVGVALIFGIELPQNFDAPLRATSIVEFWRRWHISLSTWLRDYIFTPLAFTLRDWGVAGVVASLLVTFLICGLWHGASWTFVLWGGLHGTALAFAVLWRRYLSRPPAVVGWAATFGFVTLAEVFFRADSFSAASHVFEGLAALPENMHPQGRNAMVAAVLCALVLPSSHKICRWLTQVPRLSVAVALAAAACLILVAMGGGENYDFVYFQF